MKLESKINNNQLSIIDNQLKGLPSTPVENPLQISYFYAKQSQSQVAENEHKHLYIKDICKYGLMVIQKKQTQTNPISNALFLADNEKLLKNLAFRWRKTQISSKILTVS